MIAQVKSLLRNLSNLPGWSTKRKLPIVSYDCVAGPSDIIEEGVNGFLVEVRNIDQLKNKIEYLIDNESNRYLMGETSRNMSKRYNFIDICNRYEDFMLSV